MNFSTPRSALFVIGVVMYRIPRRECDITESETPSLSDAVDPPALILHSSHPDRQRGFKRDTQYGRKIRSKARCFTPCMRTPTHSTYREPSASRPSGAAITACWQSTDPEFTDVFATSLGERVFRCCSRCGSYSAREFLACLCVCAWRIGPSKIVEVSIAYVAADRRPQIPQKEIPAVVDP